MPYIKDNFRKQYAMPLEELDGILCENLYDPGHLNYVITRIILNTQPDCYSAYNALIGIIECVKQEFYRKAVALYEDAKCKENGEVYK